MGWLACGCFACLPTAAEKLLYFDAGGDNGLNVNYAIKGGEKVPLLGGILFYQ